MAGTITTYGYCAVKDGKVFEGSQDEVVHQVCNFWFSDGQLMVQVHGHVPVGYHSFSSDFTVEERHDSAVKFIFGKLNEYRFRVYRDIGF